MAFDFGAWLLGFALSSVTKEALAATLSKNLRRKLAFQVKRWEKGLPAEALVHAEALLDPRSHLDPELAGSTALGRVLERIEDRRVPSVEEWLSALVEQWRSVRRRLGSTAQPLFQLSEKESVPHLEALARRLHQTCVEDEVLFKQNVFSALNSHETASDVRVLVCVQPGSINVPKERRRGAKVARQKVTFRLVSSASGQPPKGNAWMGFPIGDDPRVAVSILIQNTGEHAARGCRVEFALTDGAKIDDVVVEHPERLQQFNGGRMGTFVKFSVPELLPGEVQLAGVLLKRESRFDVALATESSSWSKQVFIYRLEVGPVEFGAPPPASAASAAERNDFPRASYEPPG